MNREIKFRKLFSEPKPVEQIFSIISYNKIPWIRKEYPENYLKEFTSSDPYYNNHYVAQYKKILVIDLWFMVLWFEWFTKEIMITN